MREESLKKRELVQYYFDMALLKQNAIYIYTVVPKHSRASLSSHVAITET
jgi:hypothetical protein